MAFKRDSGKLFSRKKISKVEAITELFSEDLSKDFVLEGIARFYFTDQNFTKALEVIDKIKRKDIKAFLLIKIANHYLSDKKEALTLKIVEKLPAIINLIQDEVLKAWALEDLA